MQFQLLGWGPDLDPSTPGVLVDAFNVVPQENGYTPHPQIELIYALGSATRTMAVTKVSGQLQTYYVNVDTSGTAITGTFYQVRQVNSSVSLYTENAVTNFTNHWTMRPFDDRMLFNRAGTKLLQTDGNTTATTIASSPTCQFFETSKDFVVAFRADNGAGITPDWWCCAIGDYSSWTANVSTQCVYGTFFGKDGELTASGRHGEALVAFTDTQTYVGRYVGAPDVWQWERVSGDVGCVGPEAQCQTPYGLVFVNRNDIYVFDGATIKPLDTKPVRKTLFSAVSRKLLSYAQVFYERKRDLLWFAAPAASESVFLRRNYCVAYHFKTAKWGRFQLVDNLTAFSQTPAYDWALSTATPYTDPTFDDLIVAAGLAGGARLFAPIGGESTAITEAYVETGFIGDQQVKTMVRAVRPRFTSNDNSNGTLTLKTMIQGLSGGATATQTATLDADFKYPLRQTGRWHSFKHVLTGTDVVNGYEVDLVPVGTR